MHYLSIYALWEKIRNNKRLFGNTFYLYIFQVISYVFPLITVPYLVRVLGTDTFGIIAFFSSFILYFQVIVDYGFNLSATRDVAVYKNNPIKVSGLFFSVLAIKTALMFASALVLPFVMGVAPAAGAKDHSRSATRGAGTGCGTYP